MIVRPEAMSASSAPSARPLNSCELKLAQVITQRMSSPRKRGPRLSQTRIPAFAGTTGRSGVIAEVAAEGVGLLHERPAGHDLGYFPKVLLVAHLLRCLAAHDDDRPHQLVILLAVIVLARHPLE